MLFDFIMLVVFALICLLFALCCFMSCRRCHIVISHHWCRVAVCKSHGDLNGNNHVPKCVKLRMLWTLCLRGTVNHHMKMNCPRKAWTCKFRTTHRHHHVEEDYHHGSWRIYGAEGRTQSRRLSPAAVKPSSKGELRLRPTKPKPTERLLRPTRNRSRRER